MKNIALMAVAIVGWYFVLSFFSSLHTVVGSAFGITATWFGLLFVIGSAAIAKICLSK